MQQVADEIGVSQPYLGAIVDGLGDRAEQVVVAGIPRVVLAWREPTIFVDCEGVELLESAGVDVLEFPDLAKEVKEINSYLLD